MVQFIKGSADPRDAATGALAYALGGGLTKGVTSHFANKALDEVLNNEEYAEKPQSEKIGLIQKALQPYGKPGEELFQKRMQIEQVAQEEKQQKLQNQQGQVMGKLLNGQPVTEKEQSILTPEQNLAYAKHKQAREIAELKSGTKLTQASQPINPDQLKRIQDVRKTPEYETANPAKKLEMLKDNLVSKENAESEVKPYIEAEKNKPGSKYHEEREKSIEKYVTESLAKGKEASSMDYTLDTIEKAINGDIEGPGTIAALKNDPWGQLFFGLTVDESALDTANKFALEGTKGIWGPKPTENEMFRLLNGMLPSRGKTREANLASLEVLRKSNKIKALYSDMVDEITQGSSKFVPDVESQVNSKMKPIIDEFRKELINQNEKFGSEDQNFITREDGKIKVTNAKGEEGWMTKEKIEEAKANKVIFTPVKKK